MIRAVTLDCAETLVKVRWSPGTFALDCAATVGLDLEPSLARSIYERLVLVRWPEYIEANKSRNVQLCLDWWRRITEDWLAEIGADRSHLKTIIDISNSLLYDPPDRYFELYSDVVPCLDALGRQGIPVHVLSNWDYSLHRVLRAHGLYDRFGHVIASLEEGVEKPDSRLFQIACERIGASPSETLHVGDNPSDDYDGALGAGLCAVLLDRSSQEVEPTRIPTLTAIPEWIERFASN